MQGGHGARTNGPFPVLVTNVSIIPGILDKHYCTVLDTGLSQFLVDSEGNDRLNQTV